MAAPQTTTRCSWPIASATIGAGNQCFKGFLKQLCSKCEDARRLPHLNESEFGASVTSTSRPPPRQDWIDCWLDSPHSISPGIVKDFSRVWLDGIGRISKTASNERCFPRGWPDLYFASGVRHYHCEANEDLVHMVEHTHGRVRCSQS